MYIYQDDALALMGQIEGERWMTEQGGDPDGLCSFNAFRREWEACRKSMTAYAAATGREVAELPVFSLAVEGNGAIYGLYGYHRYIVHTDGEIIFHASFCENPKKYRPLVEEAGFSVCGQWHDDGWFDAYEQTVSNEETR